MTKKYPEVLAAMLAVLVSVTTILPVVTVPQGMPGAILLA